MLMRFRLAKGSGFAAQSPAAWRRDEHGVVALEFAIIAPVMLMMMIGAFDVGRAVVVQQEAYTTAVNVAQAAVTLAAISSSGTGASTASDLEPDPVLLANSIIYGVIPETKTSAYAKAGGAYSVTLSFVQYLNGSAYITWSVPLAFGTAAMTQITRVCGGPTIQLASIPENSNNLNSIPTLNVTTQTPTLIADVHVRYIPTFFRFIGSVDFWEEALKSPITGAESQVITFKNQDPSNQYVCQNSPPS